MKRAFPGPCLLCLLLVLPACDDEPTVPLQQRTSPDGLIAALELIYNDTVRSARERRLEYSKLLLEESPGFLFRFQPSDVGTDPGGTGTPVPPSWGRDEEITAHENLFAAQEEGTVFLLTLSIQHTEAADIELPESGKEDWKRIFANKVDLRLMFNPNDGLEVDGGQARFDCAPVADRWFIGEWTDLPRPFAPGEPLVVGPATWGSIKASFR